MPRELCSWFLGEDVVTCYMLQSGPGYGLKIRDRILYAGRSGYVPVHFSHPGIMPSMCTLLRSEYGLHNAQYLEYCTPSEESSPTSRVIGCSDVYVDSTYPALGPV